MAKLDDLLAEAEKTNAEMQAAAKQGDSASREIVALRTKFAKLMADSVAAMHQDERLKANPAVRREFETKFFAFRQRLAKHQADWRKSDIDKNPAAYRESVAEVNALQMGFYDYARRELPKL